MTTQVTTEAELRELVGPPLPRAVAKEQSRIEPTHRDWLAHSPFCLVATCDADGRCDVSPKGDPPGFTLVLGSTTLALPDRPGNRRCDGFRNVLANPYVGLLYLVPGRGDALRVNGRARLIRDAPYFDRMEVRGRRPLLALEVEVEQVFFHCSKAFLRAQLWSPETLAPDAVPSRAVIAQRMERPEDTLEDLERYYGPRYAEGLY
jgi:uncharacterized protein